MSNTLPNYLSAIKTFKTMDLSVTSNIIFVAVTAALCAVFLAVIIGVIVRGKRKPNAFDAIVRVIASVVLFASAVLYAASWLCRITGKVFIDSSIPALIIVDTMRELPMPALFAALETMLGSILVLAVLILSLVALICDCLIANKKKKDEKPVKTAKTPEEVKREAEIARIRRLADSAVKKTSSAATLTKETPRDDDIEKEQKHDETIDTVENQSDDEPDFDWRVEQPKKQASSFVGINEHKDDDFDTFDTFDDVEEEVQSDRDDYYARQESDNEEEHDHAGDFAVFDDSIDTAEHEQEQETTAEETDGDVLSEHEEAEYGNETEDDFVPEHDEEPKDAKDEWTGEDIEPDRNIYIPEIRTIVREPKPVQKPKQKPATEKKPAAKTAKAKSTKSKPTATKSAIKKTSAEKPTAAKPDETKVAPKKTAAKKSSGVNDGKKSDATPKSAAQTAEKTAPKKTTAKSSAKPAANKAAKPKTAPKSKSKAEADDGKTLTIPKADAKKLPMTRRYIIINRTNAVNIFSEYLKEKDEREKEKLESSISTIILK